MSSAILEMRADVEHLKTLFGNALTVGPVHEVDKTKGYRIRKGGTDAEPWLSPWYPHPETGKTSVPLKVGQVVGMLNPTGDSRQGFLLRNGYSDDHPTPNQDMAANVFQDAGVRITVSGGVLQITAESAVEIVTPDYRVNP